jgi:hypothetical protein
LSFRLTANGFSTFTSGKTLANPRSNPGDHR